MTICGGIFPRRRREEDCRAYWIQARWSGKPAGARLRARVWTERDGFLFECADCGHQTSLTSGTVLEKARKPLKVWFPRYSKSARAARASRRWICASWASAPTGRRGVGCTSCARLWCARSANHSAPSCGSTRRGVRAGKRARKRAGSSGRRGGRKRTRTLKRSPTERWQPTRMSSQMGWRQRATSRHDRADQGGAARKRHPAWNRWLLGTHVDAVREKHLHAYLDELAFRYNRRKTAGVGRIAARVIEQLGVRERITTRELIDETRPCRSFASA